MTHKQAKRIALIVLAVFTVWLIAWTVLGSLTTTREGRVGPVTSSLATLR